MAQKDQQSFRRWQQVTRDQFGFVVNLLLTLATGLVAFQSTLLLDHKLSFCWAFRFAMASLFFLVASVVFALLCSVNRLHSFRDTAQIARRREQGETKLEKPRDEVKSKDKLTWCLLHFQLALFILGAACTALAVVIQVWPRAL